MTVPTTGPVSSPRARRSRAITYMQLVAVDQPPEVIHHDQPVAVAVERDADVGPHPATVSCSSSGAVEPQRRLMLRPLGEQPMGMISAPRSASTRGATLYAAPLAQSMTTLSPERSMPAGSVEAQNSW